jgi:hypothetical protein
VMGVILPVSSSSFDVSVEATVGSSASRFTESLKKRLSVLHAWTGPSSKPVHPVLSTGTSRFLPRGGRPHPFGPVVFFADVDVRVNNGRPEPGSNDLARVISKVCEKNRGPLPHAWVMGPRWSFRCRTGGRPVRFFRPNAV